VKLRYTETFLLYLLSAALRSPLIAHHSLPKATMSTPLQQMTPQTSAAQPKSKNPAPTRAPQKRKLPTSEKTENVKSKKPRLSTMAKPDTAKPADASVPDSPKQYGVYRHYDLSDPTSSDADLVATAPDFTTAYTKLCEHASGEIGSHPTWGATYTRTSQNVYEILDPDNAVRMRYSIDTVIPYEGDWKRERDWLAQDYLDRPPQHWGMYIDLNISPSSKSASTKNETQNFLLGGYTCLGEACHAMNTSARAYLDQHASARIMARCIELVDEKGGVRQRYRIAKGRYIQGRFVSEEEWLEEEMQGMERGEEVEWEVKKSDIKRLPTPVMTPTPVTPTPAEPALVPAPEEVEEDPEPEPEQWCTCRTHDNGSLMIRCDNEECAIQWYHGRCIGVTKVPRGKWLCAACKPAKVPTARETRAKARSETPAVRETRAKARSDTPAVRETRGKSRSELPAVKEGRVEKKTAQKGPKGGKKPKGKKR
jgi:hypothetical protein